VWGLADPDAEPRMLYGHEYGVNTLAFAPKGALSPPVATTLPRGSGRSISRNCSGWRAGRREEISRVRSGGSTWVRWNITPPARSSPFPVRKERAMTDDTSKFFALLVRIKQFANSTETLSQGGCFNDTHAVQEFLCRNFEIADGNIKMRVDSEATHHAIKENFRALLIENVCA